MAAHAARVIAQLQSHRQPVSYLSYSNGVAYDLAVESLTGLPWCVLNGQRSVARFRAGLLELGHKAGHRTRARVQSCVG